MIPDTERSNATLIFRSAHQTDSSFPTVSPTATSPADSAGTMPYLNNSIKFCVIGEGAENAVPEIIVTGWKYEPTSALYIPGDICELVATLGTKTATILSSTVRFADALTLTADKGIGDSTAKIQHEAGNSVVAWLSIDVSDWQFVSFGGKIADATSFNVICGTY